MAVASMLGVSIAILVLFVVREHRAADPILPMDLMIRPTIAASLVGSFLVGGILFGLDTYVPLYIQGVSGGNATLAGRALMPLFLAWAISVAVAARAVVHYGFRRGGMVGSALRRGGAPWVWWSARYFLGRRPWFFYRAGGLRTGNGPDLAELHPGGSACGELGPARRGDRSRARFCARSGVRSAWDCWAPPLGWELSHRLAASDGTGIDIAAALRPETHDLLSPAQLAAVQANLGLTLRDVYLQIMVLAIGAFLSALWLPNKEATLVHSSTTSVRTPRDEGLAVAASEF